jgi:superfamily II helicase
MKNNNRAKSKAVIDFMTWGSPMNQAFIIEAISRDGTEFNYIGQETNVQKVKQYMKLFGPDKAINLLVSYASAVWDGQEELRKSMKNSFISADAWIDSAKKALDMDLLVQRNTAA